MTEDARNSITLWIGGLAVFGLFGLGLHFNVFSGISDAWLWPLLSVAIAVNLAQTVWRIWKRRASDSKNSRRS